MVTGSTRMRPPGVFVIVVLLHGFCGRGLMAQTADRNGEVVPSQFRPEYSVETEPIEQAESADWKSRLRPRFDSSIEWEPVVDRVELRSFSVSVRQPLYPFFGPPPPFLNAGYSLREIESPVSFGLPGELHEFTAGLAWMRRINDRWMARIMINGAFASDLENTSSDAWQIRGGLFALYRPNDEWNFAFGAIVTGREDLPVIPAIGAIWQPSDQLKVNLMLPNPRVSWLLAESARQQHWGYVGAGISGGTWAFDRTGQDDRLTYREFRLMLGWETIPPQPPGTFRPTGQRLHVEVGYAFGRRFEFDSDLSEIELSDALMLRTGVSF